MALNLALVGIFFKGPKHIESIRVHNYWVCLFNFNFRSLLWVLYGGLTLTVGCNVCYKAVINDSWLEFSLEGRRVIRISVVKVLHSFELSGRLPGWTLVQFRTNGPVWIFLVVGRVSNFWISDFEYLSWNGILEENLTMSTTQTPIWNLFEFNKISMDFTCHLLVKYKIKEKKELGWQEYPLSFSFCSD